VLGRLGTEFGSYKAIEFSGPVVEAMGMDERMCLTVMATEMGAKATYIQPDAVTLAAVRARTAEPFVVHQTDPDFRYEAVHSFDLSELKPQVAVPHGVDQARDVDDVAGIAIDQVFIGSCTGGKFTDIEVAARLLKGRTVAKGTRLVVTMATREIVQRSLEMGYYQILLEAGAAITSPNCGACSGLLGGIMAAHERCVSTANRNFPGRMGGATEAEIFLTSPMTAAAVALTGRLNSADALGKEA
jgi:3-isopropylmalate/(R)-2-methylmalate dehydratase large subunit